MRNMKKIIAIVLMLVMATAMIIIIFWAKKQITTVEEFNALATDCESLKKELTNLSNKLKSQETVVTGEAVQALEERVLKAQKGVLTQTTQVLEEEMGILRENLNDLTHNVRSLQTVPGGVPSYPASSTAPHPTIEESPSAADSVSLEVEEYTDGELPYERIMFIIGGIQENLGSVSKKDKVNLVIDACLPVYQTREKIEDTTINGKAVALKMKEEYESAVNQFRVLLYGLCKQQAEELRCRLENGFKIARPPSTSFSSGRTIIRDNGVAQAPVSWGDRSRTKIIVRDLNLIKFVSRSEVKHFPEASYFQKTPPAELPLSLAPPPGYRHFPNASD